MLPVKDEVTDQDKKTLLEFLKEQQTKTTKTISLKKTAAKKEQDICGYSFYNSENYF